MRKILFYCGVLCFLLPAYPFAQRMDIKALEKQYQISPTLSLVSTLSKAYQEQAWWFFKRPQFNNDSTLFYFDKALALLENVQPVPHALLAGLYADLCKYRSRRSEFQLAAEMGAKALSAFEQTDKSRQDKMLYYDILWNYAYAEVDNRNEKHALDLFTKSAALFQNEKNPAIMAMLWKDQGVFYGMFSRGIEEETQQALISLQKSASFYEKSSQRNPLFLAEIYAELAWTYNVRESDTPTKAMADSCDLYYSKWQAILPQAQNPIIDAHYYAQWGNKLFRRGHSDEALDYMQISQRIVDTFQLEYHSINMFILNVLGTIFLEKKQWKQAESYFTKARDVGRQQKFFWSEYTYFLHMSTLYEQKGDYENALIASKLCWDEETKLYSERSTKNLQESELQLNVLRQEKELIQKNTERNLLLGTILITLILLGLSGLIFLRERRSKAKLEQQNRIIEEQSLALRQLDDAKNRFFTNITHEFRTPLTVVLGMTEQLAAGSEQWAVNSERPAVKNKLGLIKRNGENLLRLISQILDLAKLESNTFKINYIQGDILAFIRYITESLHSLANAQNLMLRVESEQAKIVMDYDQDRFLQIIHNLLSNAIKFTPSGGKVVLRADLKDQWLHLSVADSGAGIPPEELPHLFERFFQAKNQEYAKAGGTGIGLTLTRELVKVMGGEVFVESTVGVGSTFFVKLPVTNNSAFEEKMTPIDGVVYNLPANRMPDKNESTSDHPLTAQTVLLIEDNPDVVEYLSACLQGQFHLDFAYNGQAGIEKALENVPDLIVSDVMMPFKDGFELLDNLKNDERTSHIPIILLTAKADIQSRLTGLRKGADAYLSKPFNQEELLVTLKNLLELRRKLQVKYQQNVLATPASQLITPDPEDSFLQKVRALVEKNLSDADFEMPQLERALAMSRSQIFRKIKALTGKSPSLFIRSIRLHHGKQMLLNSTLTVSEIAYEVGFSSLNYFSDAFFEEFGERPIKVREGG